MYTHTHTLTQDRELVKSPKGPDSEKRNTDNSLYAINFRSTKRQVYS